jgi:lipid-A-disaccharide synthase
MRALGLETLFPISEIAVMGIGPVLAHFPRIARRGYQTVAAVLQAEPDVLVAIDSPGFTHAVAKRVARRRPDLPIINYVSPSVWAWRPGRAARMVSYVDHVLALLPFEPAVHARLGGPPCTYVGHPLIERLHELRGEREERAALGDAPVLLVLPGSRRSEISRLMEPFGEAVRLIAAERPGVQVMLPAVPHLQLEIQARASRWPVKPEIIVGEAAKFAAFRRAHAALAASGTVTLELGLASVPAVVAYRLDPIARALKPLVKVSSIVLTNLILGENVVPEFIDGQAKPDVLAREALALLTEGPARRRQLQALARLRAAMDVPASPSDRAAEIVVDTAENGRGRRAARLSQRRADIGM